MENNGKKNDILSEGRGGCRKFENISYTILNFLRKEVVEALPCLAVDLRIF